MKVNVRYFASVREALGTGGETIETSASDLGALRDALIARGEPHASALARGRAVRMALDQVMSSNEADPLRDGSEVAFFPPVTGG
jgi:molybdopterin synthase sulfur carrier subunit